MPIRKLICRIYRTLIIRGKLETILYLFTRITITVLHPTEKYTPFGRGNKGKCWEEIYEKKAQERQKRVRGQETADNLRGQELQLPLVGPGDKTFERQNVHLSA